MTNEQQKQSLYERLIYKNIMRKEAATRPVHTPAPAPVHSALADMPAPMHVLSKLASGNHDFLMKLAACCSKKARCKNTSKKKIG